MRRKKIALGSDHAGYEAKERARRVLEELGAEVSDKGTYGAESVDYPDFGAAVGRAVANGEVEMGVLICGSGIGISIAANKIPGVRAGVCWNEETARLARQHNDANVLCIGARFVEPGLAARMIRAFVETGFEGGRHQQRVEKISKLDAERSG
ncbi:MAG: ribose 5-phosphate isomerase B [Acidobacteria bacterium]|nr:ribose 5-phosphate isomerase B [Acidobacteriota bacterium]MCA1641444.1 ribose 5-phosphate isomerase B [Acidobacteriota bacterium]